MDQDREKLEAQIARIKEIMEMASEHRLLPDWAAIVGGTLVLAATVVTWGMTRSGDVKALLSLEPASFMLLAALWVGVVLFSLALYYFLALRDAKRFGVSLESRPSQLARRALAPSVFAAGIITLQLVREGLFGFIPGIWILLYGIGLYTSGLFSTAAPRVLGMIFAATGVVAITLLPEADLWLTALSFGAYHIGFGCYVLSKKRA